MSNMTYKQAIRILSEAKVADMPYKGCGSNHTMYDIARRMAIEALKEKAAQEEAQVAAETAVQAPVCKVGDTIYILVNDVPGGIETTVCRRVEKIFVDGKETYKYDAPYCAKAIGNAFWHLYHESFNQVFFTDKEAAVAAREQRNAELAATSLKQGDIIPFKLNNHTVISYIVEKIKIREDGTMKIRCKHGGGGRPRSFTDSEARALIRSGGACLN